MITKTNETIDGDVRTHDAQLQAVKEGELACQRILKKGVAMGKEEQMQAVVDLPYGDFRYGEHVPEEGRQLAMDNAVAIFNMLRHCGKVPCEAFGYLLVTYFQHGHLQSPRDLMGAWIWNMREAHLEDALILDCKDGYKFA